MPSSQKYRRYRIIRELPSHFSTTNKHYLTWLASLCYSVFTAVYGCSEDCIQRVLEILCPDAKKLMLYMDKLTSRVEQKVSQILPDKFAINFDGW